MIVMKNLKKCLDKCVNVVTLGFAYAQAFVVLLFAVICGRLHKGFYNVKFVKVKNKWYCKVPGFPKPLFEHTMMVMGAANMLEYYSDGADEVMVRCRVPSKHEYDAFCGFRLERTSATLTGGAFYEDKTGLFSEKEFWLCPVTLFLLGFYPKQIYIYSVHNSPTHCPIFMR